MADESVAQALIVTDDHDCSVGLILQFDEQVNDFFASIRVELAGGFVGEYDSRPIREGSRDGNTLFLSSTEGRWICIRSVADRERLEEAINPRWDLGALVVLRQGRILPRSEVGDEIELLEDDSDRLAPDFGPFSLGELRRILSPHQDLPAGRHVQEREDVEEGRLARAAIPPYEDSILGVDLDIHAIEDSGLATFDDQVARLEDWVRHTRIWILSVSAQPAPITLTVSDSGERTPPEDRPIRVMTTGAGIPNTSTISDSIGRWHGQVCVYPFEWCESAPLAKRS